jgi:hypothetical protein
MKRPMILLVTLAMLVAVAVPALAQEEATPEESTTEEPASEDSVEGPPGPPPGTYATLSFELTVKGTPPEGATFLGFIPAEGTISAPLTDPDGDGVFTGSVEVPRFPPGPVPDGAEPVSLPVQIAQNNGGTVEVIRDFGLVPLDGDKTFRAKVNFKRGSGETTAPGDGEPGSSTSNPDGTGNANKPAGPQTGEDVNEDGVIDETDGEVAAAVSDAAMTEANSSGQPVLPATGGSAKLVFLAVPFLLVAGLVIHRALRY